jgi:hypothetical protein
MSSGAAPNAASFHWNRWAPAEDTMSGMLIEALEDGLLTLTLNRPERRNAHHDA